MKSISSTKLIIAVSVFLILFYNFSFFSNVTEIYPVSVKNSGFLLSLAFFSGSITIILFSLACNRYTIKPALIAVLALSAATGYFMDAYNVVINEDMIDNIVRTDLGEAMDLLSFRYVLYMLLLGIIPSIIIYKIKIDFHRPAKELFSRLKLIAASLAIVATAIFLFSNFYASFFREHKLLRYYMNPTAYIFSTGKYVSRAFASPPGELAHIAQDAVIQEDGDHRELVILVIGETARADRFSLNGYERETNPLLKKKNAISFTNVWSCGTSTAYSVPCIFSGDDHGNFDKTIAGHTENVLDVLRNLGANVLWLDNNSDSKGVALRIPYESYKTPEKNPVCDIECRDVGMLANLQTYIDSHPKGDIFIVLHQMGNHGPAYYKRYPEEFEAFKPTCKTNELEDCTIDEINNAYDNAILYTDYFLAKTIDLLDHNKYAFEASMIYVSDHGESLGENGIYLHGLPYIFAPEAQIHVPMIIWLGDSYTNDVINLDGLKQRTGEHLTHDNIFHTILGMLEVRTVAYNTTMDLIKHHAH
jgi:lipid A ethanolaminephosphotransferase